MGYWENRQAQIMYEQMEDAEKVARELADIYAKATRELNYQIGEIFDRFTDKHNGSANQIHRSMPIAPNKIRNSVIFISPLDSIINIKIF